MNIWILLEGTQSILSEWLMHSMGIGLVLFIVIILSLTIQVNSVEFFIAAMLVWILRIKNSMIKIYGDFFILLLAAISRILSLSLLLVINSFSFLFQNKRKKLLFAINWISLQNNTVHFWQNCVCNSNINRVGNYLAIYKRSKLEFI